jgi:hypothetical protein
MRTRSWAILSGLTILLGTGASEGRAQAAPTTLGPDSFLVVVPFRDTTAIRRDLVATAQAKDQANTDRATGESLRQSAKARILRKRTEIDAITARENTAKKQKATADLIAIQADKKAAEREKDLIESRESLRQADVELAKKRVELSDARRAALELELQLALRRLDRERAGRPSGPAGARAEQVLSDIERRTLEAQQKEADRTKEVADRQKQIIQRRIEILDAQRKLVAGS